MRFGLAFVVVAACGSAPRSAPPSAHPTKGSEVRVDDLLREARAAHAKQLPLDDRSPFEVLPIGDARDVALYLDACRAGDHPACWIAMALAQQDEHARTPTNSQPTLNAAGREAVTLIERNCRAGDHDSCVALPPEDYVDHLRFPDLPGATGRSRVCRELWDGSNVQTCPADKLRAECDAGFARSCREASNIIDVPALPSAPDPNADLDKRANELSIAGCRARIVDDCGWVSKDAPEDVRYDEAVTWCDLGQRCSPLAAILLARGKKLEARDAAERGCQFFRDRCAELGVMYIEGKLPETSPGRGQRIVDFVCESVRRINGEKAMQSYTPCAHATGATPQKLTPI